MKYTLEYQKIVLSTLAARMQAVALVMTEGEGKLAALEEADVLTEITLTLDSLMKLQQALAYFQGSR